MNYLVKCRFLDASKAPKGREYTYSTNDEVTVGEIVSTENGKEIVVTAVDVPQEAIAGFEDKLKSVAKITKHETEEITSQSVEIIDSKATEIDSKPQEIMLPDISVNEENLAIVEQLPVISEQLKVFSVEIDRIVESVKLMECTEKNRLTVKRQRQKINKLLTEFERRRIAIKNEVLAPYEKFNDDYKKYVSDKVAIALKILDTQIIAIENGEKQKLRDDAESYFYEYLASKNIDWLTWEHSGIKIGLTDNKTALRREAAKFIDKVSDDLALIETQDHKSEIAVEYRKELNPIKSIATVQARVKAVEEQERLRAEREERRKQQEEQRRLQAEASEKARAEQQPRALEPPKQVPTAEPITQTHLRNSAPVSPEILKPMTPEEKKYSVAFRVNNETQERLATLKKYLVENGYEYVQVPLRNIMEREAV